MRRLLLAIIGAVLFSGAPSAGSADLQWYSIDKPMYVEDMTEFSVWLLGWREGSPAVAGQLIRANASVPALTSAISSKVMNMIATAPMNSAVNITGLRVLYATKTLRNARVETPALETPVVVPAGKAIAIRYDLSTGKVSITPL